MTKLPEDHTQRQQALDTSQSYIVQAPAGSGKTELISQRFLGLLAKTDKPESVLAITFTRKAANEMRLRILSALKSASEPEPDEPHKKQTWQLACAAMQQDKQLGWNLLTNSSRLRVVTIDSLNASLTRQMPLLSRMGTQASPTEQAEPFYQEAARRTMDELENSDLTDDLSLLMLHLGNNQSRIQDLLVSMLARRDQWLRHLLPLQQHQDARHALESSLQHYVSDHLQRLHDQLPAGILQSLIDLAHFASQNLPAGSTSKLALWQDQLSNTLGNTLGHSIHELTLWQSLAELILTGSNTARKTISQKEGFPPPSKEKDPERKQLLNEKKQNLLDLVGEIKQDDKLFNLIVGLRFMPATSYTDQQWQLVNALGRILLHSVLELRVMFSEAGQVDFAEIALSANDALGDTDNPTELGLIQDYRLQHILVDEFQDTSQGQMALLEKLTAGWQHNDGRTLFVVGDPMQSIYRFREAEVGLYLKAREQGIGDVKLQPLTLSVNFRSQQGIVDWVNQQLDTAFASEINVFTGAVTYSPSVANHELLPGDAVHVHGYAGNDDEQEAQEIANLVHNYQQQQPEAKIAILVRSRGHLASVVDALKAQKLRFQAVELDPLRDQPCIIDIYTLTRALINKADRLHWLALLHAPWCGLNLPDLEILSGDNQPSILANCLNPDVIAKLGADAQQHLSKCLASLEPVLQKPGKMTLRDTLSFAWQQLGGNVIYPGNNNANAISAYLDLVEKREQSGTLPDLKAFDAALDKLHAQPDAQADDHLQLMTIHKSKGLEFDIVILPGLGKGAKHDQPGLLEWLETPGEHGQGELMMAPIKASEQADSDAISKSLQFINKEKARHERVRLLYVALTRAKQRLHLFGHVNINAKGKRSVSANSLLNILYPQLESHFEDLQAIESPSTDNVYETAADNKQYFKRLPLNWQPEQAKPLDISQTIETTESQAIELEFDWAGETARFIGILTHRYLEQMASTGTQPEISEGHIRTALLNLGTHPEEVNDATTKVIKALNHALSDERGQWILKAHPQAQVEYGLTCKTDTGYQRFIIDRTFVDEQGTRWIIDYKTGSHAGSDIDAFLDQEQERYRNQLDNYASLFAQIENHPIKLGLYFPMLKGWREWEYKTT